MSAGREPIRSYQRLFRPERRLHQIEGRALPIPGGVPLRWLGYAGGALLAVLALASGSGLVDVGAGIAAAAAGAILGGRRGAALAGASAFAGAWVAGQALALLDWPLRLLMIPAGVATVGTQATPDGRSAHRFALSWLALRLSPRRRSLGRAMPLADTPRLGEGSLWAAPDEHGPLTRAGRVRGEGEVFFRDPVLARRSRLRQGRIWTRPAGGRKPRRGEVETSCLAIAAGESLEVRR